MSQTVNVITRPGITKKSLCFLRWIQLKTISWGCNTWRRDVKLGRLLQSVFRVGKNGIKVPFKGKVFTYPNFYWIFFKWVMTWGWWYWVNPTLSTQCFVEVPHLTLWPPYPTKTVCDRQLWSLFVGQQLWPTFMVLFVYYCIKTWFCQFFDIPPMW